MNRKSKNPAAIHEGYDVIVTGRHVLVTDAMKDYVIEKISRIDRLFDRIIDIQVTMDIQKLEHRVDIISRINQIKIKSSASSTDMYVSIDLAVDKLEKQLLKYKDKLQDHQHQSMSGVDIYVNVLQPAQSNELNEINQEIEEENLRQLMNSYSSHKIVERKTIPLHTMSYEDAILRMDLSSDDSYMIFKNIENNQLSVIARREDGNYDIVEPNNVRTPESSS